MSRSSAKSLADARRVTLNVAINRSPKNLTGKHARGLRRFRFAAERRHSSPPKPAAKRALAQFHGPTRILMQAFGSLAHLTLSRNLAKPTILNDSEAPPAPARRLDIVRELHRGPYGVRTAFLTIDAQAIMATPLAAAHLPRLVDQSAEQRRHMTAVLHKVLGMPLHTHKEATILRLHAFH